MTAPRLSLILPLPPTIWRLHVGTGKSQRRTPEYVAWLHEAGWRINEARPRWALRGLPPDAPYRARVRWPHGDGADADNRLKALFDLLVTMRVTPDDRMLDGGSFGRSQLVPPGCCSVAVWSIGGAR